MGFNDPYPGDTQQYLKDPEFIRLASRFNGSHSGKDYKALKDYYTRVYGPIPDGYNLISGKLDQDDSLKKTAAIALPLMATGVNISGLLPSSGPNPGNPNASVAATPSSGIPTTPSTPIGTGMGFDPPSIPGSAPVFGDDIPTIPSRTFGDGLGTPPAQLPPTIQDTVWDATLGKWVKKAGNALTDRATGDGGLDDYARMAFAALAGLPGLLHGNGPSDEERAYQSQATRLLGQQEQRTQYQNPLYEATTKMAFGLMPNMGNGGNPYPINSLNDVKVPTLEDLIKQQRRD
jgi:hypothetical protein